MPKKKEEWKPEKWGEPKPKDKPKTTAGKGYLKEETVELTKVSAPEVIVEPKPVSVRNKGIWDDTKKIPRVPVMPAKPMDKVTMRDGRLHRITKGRRGMV